MKRWHLNVVWIVVACVAIGLWWDNGGQHWSAFQTGTYCGSSGDRYCYWSGFGSVFPWVLFSMGGLFTALWLFFKHTNCHVSGCWRVGKYPLAGGAYKVCGHHNPDIDGHRPTLEHILEAHRKHKEAHRGGLPVAGPGPVPERPMHRLRDRGAGLLSAARQPRRPARG